MTKLKGLYCCEVKSVDSGLEIGTHQLHTYFSNLGKRIGKAKVKKT